jgi:hypothetical protein
MKLQKLVANTYVTCYWQVKIWQVHKGVSDKVVLGSPISTAMHFINFSTFKFINTNIITTKETDQLIHTVKIVNVVHYLAQFLNILNTEHQKFNMFLIF